MTTIDNFTAAQSVNLDMTLGSEAPVKYAENVATGLSGVYNGERRLKVSWRGLCGTGALAVSAGTVTLSSAGMAGWAEVEYSVAGLSLSPANSLHVTGTGDPGRVLLLETNGRGFEFNFTESFHGTIAFSTAKQLDANRPAANWGSVARLRVVRFFSHLNSVWTISGIEIL